jgi:protein O-GlcNAc transferase
MPSEISHNPIAEAKACRARGDLTGAIGQLTALVNREPANADALNNLGLLYFETGETDKAIECYKRALSATTKSPEANSNLAIALLSKGDSDGAERYFSVALAIKPDLAPALLGLSEINLHRGDLTAAKNLLCDAIRVQPDSAVAHFMLGKIMREWERLDLAAGCFRNAIHCKPDYALAYNNLGETLQAAGEIGKSEACFRKALVYNAEDVVASSNLFISMNYNPAYRPEQLFNAHRIWGDRLIARVFKKGEFSNVADAGRKIRLGICSSDFCDHPAASFLGPVMKNYDRNHFEIVCYSQGRTTDAKTETFKKLSLLWRDISALDDAAAVQTIKADGIDILIDATGHMGDNRLPLFARRCAPVQVSWIGYPNTTGLSTVDYRFTDAITDPPGEPHPFVERLVCLEKGFCCWAPPETAPPVSPLPALRSGTITFGSLHNLARLNDTVIALWSKVLLAIPAARLLIFRTTLNDEIVTRLQKSFANKGIDATRLLFDSKVPSSGHLSIYDRIDIALDTLPWSGHTTACQALWMGVPTITLCGDRHAGRMAASVLRHTGLPQFIATYPEEFAAKAVEFTNNISRLAALRSSLRERVRASDLCNAAAFARIIEKEFREMWKQWCERKAV